MSLTLSSTVSPSSPAMTADTEVSAADEKDTPTTTTTELDVAPYLEETVPPASPEMIPDTEVASGTPTTTTELDIAPHAEDTSPAMIPDTDVNATAEKDNPTTTTELDVAPHVEDTTPAMIPDTEPGALRDLGSTRALGYSLSSPSIYNPGCHCTAHARSPAFSTYAERTCSCDPSCSRFRESTFGPGRELL
ncbi:hypothetical protein C8R44DRAFT_192656 [Mycena epipterygia]|nr:hypothetical protein C8R44DRAFT_192656 [Mycena epipterygia]